MDKTIKYQINSDIFEIKVSTQIKVAAISQMIKEKHSLMHISLDIDNKVMDNDKTLEIYDLPNKIVKVTSLHIIEPNIYMAMAMGPKTKYW